jgi:hypothetical protein
MSTSAKRIGRPVKAPARGKRAPLSLLVAPELKRKVEKATRDSGRTMAAEAEALIEQGMAAAELLAHFGTTITEQLAEKNFRDRGYTWAHTRWGKIFFPPGFPGAPPSSPGFMSDEEAARFFPKKDEQS